MQTRRLISRLALCAALIAASGVLAADAPPNLLVKNALLITMEPGQEAPFTGYFTVEDIYWFTLHGSLDFVRNGITTAYDFTKAVYVGGEQLTDGIELLRYDEDKLRREIDTRTDRIRKIAAGEGPVVGF